MFNEITKKAVQEAFKHPREIDEQMVDAQRARRVLDRLVGYKISPHPLGQGAARPERGPRAVGGAAPRVRPRGRDREVRARGVLAPLRAAGRGAAARVRREAPQEGRRERSRSPTRRESKAALADLERAEWRVASVQTKERKRHPAPPFITSKLQQTARFPVKKTMMLAQQLYEGIELPGLGVDGPVGLITYMRTDSVRVADEALTAVRDHIKTTFGDDYLPEKANAYKSKADAQDAHEAIRPTSLQYDPETVKAFLTAGSVLALPPDLEPLRRVADDARHVRRDDRGRRRERFPVPREGHGAEVRGLAGDLRPDARRDLRRRSRPARATATTTRRRACCRRSRRATAWS